MDLSGLLKKVRVAGRKFASAKSGNVMVISALCAVPLLTGVGAAVDTSRAVSVRTALQSGLDSAALNMMKVAPTMSDTALASAAKNMVTANFNRSEAQNVQVVATYSTTDKTLTMTGSADVPTSFMTLIGFPQMTVNGATTAKIGMKRLPVCVLVTDPSAGHTLLVKNGATINFTDCMVQVNTQNWDAVEARDTSYIHSTNGVNCFTGDIHYGDVTPPKMATCDMLPDPYASYTVPTNTCTYNKKSVNSTQTLSPGTYCGGLNISGGNVTLSPGIYYIQAGDLNIGGSANVTANGVTFLISGSGSNFAITTSGKVTMSPYLDPSAGQWAGFQVYYDPPSAAKATNTINTISKATVTMSGVIYLAGQTLSITSGANVTVSPGAIIAGFILPDGANLTLSSMMGSSNPAVFAKSVEGTAPVLVK